MPMLVLGRKLGQRVVIRCGGAELSLWVSETSGGKVRLVFDAPPEVLIYREEVLPPERPAAKAAP